MQSASCDLNRLAAWLMALTALCILVLTAPLRAGQALRLECYPTFESLGLRLHYGQGLAEGTRATVRFRQAGTDVWHEALPLSPISGNRFAGSIFFLAPATRYEVRVTLEDQEGGGTVSQTVATRSEVFPQGSGREYYVDPAGDDQGPGTSGWPFRTITRAAAAAAAGDIVRVNSGVYREQVLLTRSGRKDAYISFVAQGRGVVITGADSIYDKPETDALWRDQGGGVYLAEPGYLTRYIACNGLRLYHYLSREEFDRLICGAPGGWFQEEDGRKLYVRLSSGDNPGKSGAQIAALDYGFRLEKADYVLIDGFEIQHFGRASQGEGVALIGSSWNVVRNCSVHGMSSVILLDHDGARDAEDNLIHRCELWDTSITGWPWAMSKAHDEEGGGVISRGGRGNVVRGCRFHGLFDALAPSAWEAYEDERYNCDWDVCDNEITDIRDDVIEPEGPCINFRFWNNYCKSVFVGVSLAPIYTGPTYVLYNVIHDLDLLSIKYNGIGSGVCHLYHNTIYTSRKESDALRASDPIEGQILRNNIFYGDGLAINVTRLPLDTNDIDYDLWFNRDALWTVRWTESIHKRLFQLGGRLIYTLADLTRLTGWEPHGFYSDPMLTCPEQSDFRLRQGSPCIDSGVRLPNINDGFFGTAPDLGAFEFGALTTGHFPLGIRRN